MRGYVEILSGSVEIVGLGIAYIGPNGPTLPIAETREWAKLKDFGASAQRVLNMIVDTNLDILYANVLGDHGVWSYNGSTWTALGFSSSVRTMVFYDSKLYVSVGEVIHVYNGSWSTFKTFIGSNHIYSMAVYEGDLYVGVSTTSKGNAFISKYNGSTWATVYTFDAQTFEARVMYVSGSDLYVGTRVYFNQGPKFIKFNGSSWTVEHTFGTGFDLVQAVAAYNGDLYVGLGQGGNDADIYTDKSGSWVLEKDFGSDYRTVWALEVYNSKLYAGLGWGNAYFSVYDGFSWAEEHEFSVNYDEVVTLRSYKGDLLVGLGNSAGDGDIWSNGAV